MISYDNYQRITSIIDHHQEQADQAEKIRLNLREDESPLNLHFISNNYRFGLADKTIELIIRKKVGLAGFDLSGDRYTVLCQFAEGGDLLAQSICEYFEFELGPKSDHTGKCCILNASGIPERLLLRQMSESEYNGYLSGNIPLCTTNSGLRYVLPSKERLSELRNKDSGPAESIQSR